MSKETVTNYWRLRSLGPFSQVLFSQFAISTFLEIFPFFQLSFLLHLFICSCNEGSFLVMACKLLVAVCGI